MSTPTSKPSPVVQHTDPAQLSFTSEPPPRNGGRKPRTFPDATLRALRRNPGQWAKVGVAKNNRGTDLTRSLHKAGHHDIEVIGRRTPGADTYDLWATSNIDVTVPR